MGPKIIVYEDLDVFLEEVLGKSHQEHLCKPNLVLVQIKPTRLVGTEDASEEGPGSPVFIQVAAL
jgi:hypothetical protein